MLSCLGQLFYLCYVVVFFVKLLKQLYKATRAVVVGYLEISIEFLYFSLSKLSFSLSLLDLSVPSPTSLPLFLPSDFLYSPFRSPCFFHLFLFSLLYLKFCPNSLLKPQGHDNLVSEQGLPQKLIEGNFQEAATEAISCRRCYQSQAYFRRLFP